MPSRPHDPAAREQGRRLKAVREALGLRQDEVAKRIGLSPSAIGHYETGRARISLPDVHRLASALGMSTAELLSRLQLSLAPEDVAPAPVDVLHRALEPYLGPDEAGEVAAALAATPNLTSDERTQLAEVILAMAERLVRRRQSRRVGEA